MAEIPSADWSWINEAAERFERAWKKGTRPRIEDFLAKEPEPRRPQLLSELIRVERELRAGAGERPTAEEYRCRFPEHDDVVASVFAPAPTASRRPSKSPPGGAATAAASGPASTLPPELANHPDYEIIRELGHGGMGVVFLAHNRIMGLNEVLKVVGPDVIKSPGVFDRFQREIRTVSRLHHPNIVAARYAFRCGESLVFAMEYVEGLDLARTVKAKGPVPVGRACYFVHQAAQGLQHAHEAGTVHRDIKPSNLMLTHKEGKAVIKVLDFGLAKAEREQEALDPIPAGANRDLGKGRRLTLTEDMLGTPDFIAPEQIADSQGADIRADIYSLGCTLYFLLSGRPPFDAASIRDTLRGHRSIEAPLLHLVRPEVPAELASLVAKMMAKEPDLRFQTPSEVASALAPFFKKPTAATVSADVEVDQDFAPDAGRGALAAAAEPGHGMWSDLIDMSETEDDADAVAKELNPARERSRWLWPALPAGVLLCGLFGAWAGGVFKGVLVTNDAVELAGEDVGTGTEEKKPIRVRREPVVASEPSKTPAPVTEPSPKTEARTPKSDSTSPALVATDVARETSPPVADPAPRTGAPTPTSNAPAPAQVFHEIASIPTSDPVIQARLLPDARHVLYETGGGKRALWRGDLTDPKNPRTLKLELNDPSDWSRLVLASDGRFAILAGKDRALWDWDLQTGQSRPLRSGGADITAIALSPDNQFVAYVSDGVIQFCDAFNLARGKKKGLHAKFGSGTDLIAFCPDGRRIVSTNVDRSIHVSDVKTRKEIGRPAETPKLVSDLAVFPDGRRVLVSLSGPTVVWDLDKNRQLRQASGFGGSVALTADGRRALMGGGQFMRLLDLDTDEELIREDHKKTVVHVAFSSDDRQAVSTTEDVVHVWALPPDRAAAEQGPIVEDHQQFLAESGHAQYRRRCPDLA